MIDPISETSNTCAGSWHKQLYIIYDDYYAREITVW